MIFLSLVPGDDSIRLRKIAMRINGEKPLQLEWIFAIKEEALKQDGLVQQYDKVAKEMAMSNVKSNGITIEYDSFGSSDKDVILLISGLGVQMIRWRVTFCEMLAAQGFSVIRFDNRDAGLSTCFDEVVPPSFEDLAETLG